MDLTVGEVFEMERAVMGLIDKGRDDLIPVAEAIKEGTWWGHMMMSCALLFWIVAGVFTMIGWSLPLPFLGNGNLVLAVLGVALWILGARMKMAAIQKLQEVYEKEVLGAEG
jgi:protein-S-isoprenylcysteine O-methyltransferase Ste14